MNKSITFIPRSSDNTRRAKPRQRFAHNVSLADFVIIHEKNAENTHVSEKKPEKSRPYKFRKQPARKSQKSVTFDVPDPVKNPPMTNKNDTDKINTSPSKSRHAGKPPLHPGVANAKNIENSLEMEQAVMFRNTRRRMANAEKEIKRLREINQKIMKDLRRANNAAAICDAIYRDALTIIRNNKKPVIRINSEGMISIIAEDIQ